MKKKHQLNKKINKQQQYNTTPTPLPLKDLYVVSIFLFLHWKFIFCNIPLLMVNI